MNRKFVFLIREFMLSMNIPSSPIDSDQALVGNYGELECRIEDGSRIGVPGKLFILIKLDNYKLNADMVLDLNSNFKLLAGCYITRIEDHGYFLIKIYSVPNHVNQLHNYMNETVSSAQHVIKEIKEILSNVVD